MFAFLDTDANGALSRLELRGTSAVAVFHYIDGNGDGQITVEEFVRNAPGWIHAPRFVGASYNPLLSASTSKASELLP